MKGSEVLNPYPNSNFLNFDGYTLPFWIKIFSNITHAHCPESQIVAKILIRYKTITYKKNFILDINKQKVIPSNNIKPNG